MGFCNDAVKKKEDDLGQKAKKRVGGAAGVKSWIKKHPEQATGIVAGILAPPLAIAAVPLMLGVLGFKAGGVVANSVAGVVQSIIGNVAAGSLFSILQSAAMGGESLALVNWVVGGSVAVVAIGANIPGIVRAVNEDKVEEKTDKKKSKQ